MRHKGDSATAAPLGMAFHFVWKPLECIRGDLAADKQKVAVDRLAASGGLEDRGR